MARSEGETFLWRFNVALAGAEHALVLSAGATPQQLMFGGGTVHIDAVVRYATTCRLELLSRQSFPVVYASNSRPCTSGSFSANVVIGPNSSPVRRTVAFALVASNNTSSFSGIFDVLLGASSSTATTATVPVDHGSWYHHYDPHYNNQYHHYYYLYYFYYLPRHLIYYPHCCVDPSDHLSYPSRSGQWELQLVWVLRFWRSVYWGCRNVHGTVHHHQCAVQLYHV